MICYFLRRSNAKKYAINYSELENCMNNMREILGILYKKTKNTIFGQFFISVTLIIIVALLLLGAVNYQYSRWILIKSISEKNEIIFEEIKDILALQDASLNVIENNLNQRAKKLSDQIIGHIEAHKKVEDIDLEALSAQLGMDSLNEDIYLINKHGIVINTTFQKDLYLNFFDFGEEHKSYLLNVFDKSQFVSERFAIESSTKRLRKYTYQPTSTSDYIVELGFYSQKADEIASFVKQILNKLSQKNENIISVDLFIGEDAPFSLNNSNLIIDENSNKAIKSVLDNRTNHGFDSYHNESPVYVEYIFMSRNNTDLYKNSVIRIITDRTDEKKALVNLFFYSFVIFGVTLLIVVYSIYKKAKSVSKPIEKLVANVKRITMGNYKERAIVEGRNEISEFSLYFNQMLDEIERSYNELEKSRARAEESDRLKSAFLANMSHEIRTPMNAVIGFTEILDVQIENPIHKEYLQSIKSSGKNLLSIINDILDLSKIEAGKLELVFNKFNPDIIFKEMKQIFEMQLKEKNVEFVLDVKQSMPEILLDEVRFKQILINLVGNAVKFTNEGHIKLSVSYEFSGKDENSCDLKIDIEDTGLGIDKDSQKLIFEPFKQKDNQDTKKYGGTGLGLSITKRLTEMMNGEIMLQSEVDKGSVFRVVFRDVEIKLNTEVLNETDLFVGDEIEFKNQSVLVVDDVEINRRLIIEYLKSKNLRIIEASNGEEAIQKVFKKKPDIVLLDIRMPVMDGFEAIKHIKSSKYSSTPVIAVTASVMKEEKERMARAKFDGFLQKPIRSAELYKQLMKFLDFQILQTADIEEEDPEAVEMELELKEISKKAKDIIKESLYLRWQTALETQMITDIQEFAITAKKIGSELSIESVANYGDLLYNYTESFDIDKMNSSMKNFPEVLRKLKIEL